MSTQNPNNCLTKKKIINSILNIKKRISEKLRDRIYLKDFTKQIIELIYEIDDYEQYIDVEILEKTDLHKCFKSLLCQQDIYSDMKESCYSLLEKISSNILNELFNTNIKILIDACDINYNIQPSEKEKQIFLNELQSLIDQRNNDLEEENCFIRTDSKFLEIIKRNETNMMLDAKRRQKMKKNELEKIFLSENSNKNNNVIHIIESNNIHNDFLGKKKNISICEGTEEKHNKIIIFKSRKCENKGNINCNENKNKKFKLIKENKVNNCRSSIRDKENKTYIKRIRNKNKDNFVVIVYKNQLNFDFDVLYSKYNTAQFHRRNNYKTVKYKNTKKIKLE